MPDVECDNCGELHYKKPAKLENRENVFCSRECYHEFGRPDMRGENNHNHKEMVELVCENCGSAFHVHQYRKDTARFCGRECKDEYMTGQVGEEAPAYKAAKEVYTCLNCGDEFEEYPYRNDRNYCSRECFEEALQELYTGDGNPVWRGGRVDNYGPNWKEQREKALKRDGYTCQHCGKHANEMGRSPDVHHKKRLGWFKEEYGAPEWYEKGNKVDNLVTLCAACHMAEEWKNGGLD